MKSRPPLAVLLVLCIGSLQLVGYILHIDALRKLGQLSAASPLPLVFSHFRGLETFSPRFAVVVTTPSGSTQHIPITSENYAKIGGPYNRRNVYGVAFAFGAVLDRPHEKALVDGVLRHGFCPNGPIRSLLEEHAAIDSDSSLAIHITPKDGTIVSIPVHCAT